MADLSMTINNTIEITLVDPLTNEEGLKLVQALSDNNFECSISKSNRVIVVEVDEFDDLQMITAEMGELGLVEAIGLIKHITMLEPQWEREIIISY